MKIGGTLSQHFVMCVVPSLVRLTLYQVIYQPSLYHITLTLYQVKLTLYQVKLTLYQVRLRLILY